MNTHFPGFNMMHPCINDCWRRDYVRGKLFRPLAGGEKHFRMIGFQALDESFDNSSLIGTSKKPVLPNEASVTGMHQILSDSAAQLTSAGMKKIIAQHPALP